MLYLAESLEGGFLTQRQKGGFLVKYLYLLTIILLYILYYNYLIIIILTILLY
jgi:hypothetical protein